MWSALIKIQNECNTSWLLSKPSQNKEKNTQFIKKKKNSTKLELRVQYPDFIAKISLIHEVIILITGIFHGPQGNSFLSHVIWKFLSVEICTSLSSIIKTIMLTQIIQKHQSIFSNVSNRNLSHFLSRCFLTTLEEKVMRPYMFK